MENKACGKEAGVARGWTISSPTSLAVDSLGSWAARGVALGMEVAGEERTWSIHSRCHWRTFTMGRQLNYNLARMYCVALVMGREARQVLSRNVQHVGGVACAS